MGTSFAFFLSFFLLFSRPRGVDGLSMCTVPHTQVMLRWGLQKGYVILPKSVTPSRIQENSQLFDFELNKDEMNKLDALHKTNLRLCWDCFGLEYGDVSKWKWGE